MTAASRWPGRVAHVMLKVVLPLGVSGVLVWCFLRQVDWHDVHTALGRGCDYWWIAAGLAALVASCWCRAMRWGIQLNGVGLGPLTWQVLCCSMFGAWALNLVFPRLGEAWRCVYIAHHQGKPLMTVVGTDIGDRTADLVCVAIFVGVALVWMHPQMMEFGTRFAVGRVASHLLGRWWLWAGLAALAAGVWALCRWRSGWGWVAAMKRGLVNMWQGFAILFHLPRLGLYLWLTLGIWVTYFLETWLSFRAFGFTREWMAADALGLGLLPGFLCMVFGVCSTLVPSNGGLGPWTIATACALELFGLQPALAVTYALVVWFFQSALLVVIGLGVALYVGADRRRRGAGT